MRRTNAQVGETSPDLMIRDARALPFTLVELRPPQGLYPPLSSLVIESHTVPLLGSPSLSSLVAPTDSIVIAVTDATRSSPDRILVGGLLRVLADAGVARERI